jgi:hypothetical protein
MQVNIKSGRTVSLAHADEVVFNTDLLGPDGTHVKFTVMMPWGQGQAWLDSLRDGKPVQTNKRQKSVLAGN